MQQSMPLCPVGLCSGLALTYPQFPLLPSRQQTSGSSHFSWLPEWLWAAKTCTAVLRVSLSQDAQLPLPGNPPPVWAPEPPRTPIPALRDTNATLAETICT